MQLFPVLSIAMSAASPYMWRESAPRPCGLPPATLYHGVRKPLTTKTFSTGWPIRSSSWIVSSSLSRRRGEITTYFGHTPPAPWSGSP
jgi:hypothetical protein